MKTDSIDLSTKNFLYKDFTIDKENQYKFIFHGVDGETTIVDMRNCYGNKDFHEQLSNYDDYYKMMRSAFNPDAPRASSHVSFIKWQGENCDIALYGIIEIAYKSDILVHASRIVHPDGTVEDFEREY